MELIRPAFHQGQLLTAEDLDRVVRYVEALHARQNLAGGTGVRRGLACRLQAGEVMVDPGFAVAPSGRMVHLADASSVSVEGEDAGLVVLRTRRKPIDASFVAWSVEPESASTSDLSVAERLETDLAFVEQSDVDDVVLGRLEAGVLLLGSGDDDDA